MELQAFNEGCTAYMVQHKDGRYIKRDDIHSLATALIEGIQTRDRKIEDLENALQQAKVSLYTQTKELEAHRQFLLDN